LRRPVEITATSRHQVELFNHLVIQRHHSRSRRRALGRFEVQDELEHGVLDDRKIERLR
jgi:hypothetical protein